MARKSFSGAASATTLTAAINSSVATISVANATGYPSSSDPFVIVIARGTAAEEKVLIASVAGTAFTVASSGRGYDATTAQSHAAGETVEHCIDSGTIDEANAHVNDDTLDAHSQYLNTTRHDVIGRHAFGGALGTPSAPPAITTASGAGSASTPARSDHTHNIGSGAINSSAMFGASVVVIGGALAAPAAPADTGAAATGTATSAARADHVHKIGSASVGPGLVLFGNAIVPNVDTTTIHINGSNQLEAVPGAGTVSDGSITTVKLAALAVTRAKLNALLPYGYLGSDTKTASQGGITTVQTISNLGPAPITPGSNRRLRITVFAQTISGTTGDEQALVKILKDGAELQRCYVKAGNMLNMTARDDFPTATAHAYTVTMAKNVGTGSMSFDASVSNEAYIEVIDVGGT